MDLLKENTNLIIILIAFFICFIWMNIRFDYIDKNLKQIIKELTVENQMIMKSESIITSQSQEKIKDLDQLRQLKKYIQEMKRNLSMVPYMMKSIDSEIDLQERMLYSAIGKEIYQEKTKEEEKQ